MEKIYKTYRIVDNKPRWVVTDEGGNIVDRNVSKEKLKLLEEEPHKVKKDSDMLKGTLVTDV